MGQSKWGLVCALSVSLIAGRLVAQEASDNKRTPKNAEERIELQLKQPLKSPLEFIETPLNSVMDVIAEEYHIPIQFDQRALDAVAQSPETEVTIDVRQVSLRSALDLIFASTEDLTYIVDKEVLLITTEDEANSRLEVRVYRVDDLLVPDPRVGLLGSAGDADYDSLVDLIVASVEGDSWSENGTGEGEIRPFAPGMLVVSQTRRVHEQIESLLDELRRTKAAVLADAARQDDDHLVTRGIRLNPDVAQTGPAQDTIRDTLMRSVRWDEASGELGDRASIAVLPTHVLVRHTPTVVRQVMQAVRDMALEAAEVEAPRVIGGGLGAGTAASSAATGEAGESGGRRGRRGGF